MTVTYALNNKKRNNAQIYYEVATGIDLGDNITSTDIMNGANVTSKTPGNKNFQRINPETFKRLTLPNVNESNEYWYITNDGQVFNASGFVYEDRTYFNSNCFCEGKVPSSKSKYNEDIAEKVAEAIINGETIVEF